MRRTLYYCIPIAVALISLSSFAMGDDLFDKIEKELSSAAMVTLKVEVINRSKIFNSADTSAGDISIAGDGRYSAHLNDDIYLFDGKCIWEFSAENNQATKQCLKDGEKFENRLFFLKDLDKHYASQVIHKKTQYLLTLRNKKSASLPDSLTVHLNSRLGLISKINYRDLNNDLNEVIIKKQSLFNRVDTTSFQIRLPDSTEIINLP